MRAFLMCGVWRLVVHSDQLQGVELSDGTVVPRAAVFVRARFVPNADLLTGLGCAMDENGWAVPDPVGRTTVAGIWSPATRPIPEPR